jgi:uncharacterized protein (TIGR02217 family)
MAHHDDVFMPHLTLAPGVEFGHFTSDQVWITGSGRRKSNKIWDDYLFRGNAGYGIQTPEIAFEVMELALAVGITRDTFLMRNPNLWNTTSGKFMPGDESFITGLDMPLKNTTDGTYVGDGTTAIFQMVLRYEKGSASFEREIKKPENGTAIVTVDTVVQTEVTHYTINYSTGAVTFEAGFEPGVAAVPKYGSAFYEVTGLMNRDVVQQLVSFNGTATPRVIVQGFFE